jgi:hypothetical protein
VGPRAPETTHFYPPSSEYKQGAARCFAARFMGQPSRNPCTVRALVFDSERLGLVPQLVFKTSTAV